MTCTYGPSRHARMAKSTKRMAGGGVSVGATALLAFDDPARLAMSFGCATNGPRAAAASQQCEIIQWPSRPTLKWTRRCAAS